MIKEKIGSWTLHPVLRTIETNSLRKKSITTTRLSLKPFIEKVNEIKKMNFKKINYNTFHINKTKNGLMIILPLKMHNQTVPTSGTNKLVCDLIHKDTLWDIYTNFKYHLTLEVHSFWWDLLVSLLLDSEMTSSCLSRVPDLTSK